MITCENDRFVLHYQTVIFGIKSVLEKKKLEINIKLNLISTFQTTGI